MPNTRSHPAASSRPLGFAPPKPAPPKPAPLRSVASEPPAGGDALLQKDTKASGATHRPIARKGGQDQDEEDEEDSRSSEGAEEEEDPPDDSDVDKLGSPNGEQATVCPRAALASNPATPSTWAEAARPANQILPGSEGGAGTGVYAPQYGAPMETDIGGKEDELGDDGDDAGEAPNALAYSEQSTYGEDSTVPGAAYSGRNATLDKPFGCSDPACDRAFARRSDLLRHFRIHSDDKPFQCDRCDKRFVQRSALVVHIRTHTGERPHVCEVCKSRFADSSSLARHRRIHTGLRPYTCKHCSKTYCRKSTLARHHQKMHDPQRFALEHEAAKAKQAAILQRRRNGLEQRVGSQRVDQPAVQYQLPEPVAPRQRRPVDSDFAMNTSHDARAEYSESAYPSFPLSRCSLPTEARAPRYALDAFGRAYEVDEYGNSVARELVQLELAPLRDSRPSTSGGAPRLPSPFQFGHPTLSRSLYSGHISAPIANQYSFVDEEAHVSQQYDPRYPLLSQDAERRWNQSGRSVSLGRAHSSDDRRINPPSSSIEWQSSTWPLAPASSAYYQAYRTPHLAPSDSPARAPPPAGIRDFDGPQAGMSATLSHAHGPDDNTPVLSSRVPSLRAGAPSPEGTRWLRSGPVGALSQNPSADASAPLPPRDPNLHPSQYSTGAHDLPRPLLTHSDPPSSFASSPKTTATRTSVSSPDPNPVFSAARERQTMAYSPVDSPPGQLRDADTLLEGNAPGHESSPPSA